MVGQPNGAILSLALRLANGDIPMENDPAPSLPQMYMLTVAGSSREVPAIQARAGRGSRADGELGELQAAILRCAPGLHRPVNCMIYLISSSLRHTSLYNVVLTIFAFLLCLDRIAYRIPHSMSYLIPLVIG